MTDETKSRRRAQANKIHIKASPYHMPFAEFERMYVEKHLVASEAHRESMEATMQVLICDECVSPFAFGGMKANILHVTIEDDPLQNFWKLATVRCYGCGFEEHIPLDMPQFIEQDNVNSTLRPGQIISVSDVWEAERQRQLHLHQALNAQQAAAIQQRQILQRLQEYKDREAKFMEYPKPPPKPPEIGVLEKLAEKILRGR